MTLEAINNKTKNLITLEQRRDLILREIGEIQVKDDSTLLIASECLIRLRALIREAESLRKVDTEPLLRAKQARDKQYAEALRLVKQAEMNIDNAIRDFKRAESERIRKEQEKADRLAQRQFDRQIEKGQMPVIPEPVSKMVEPEIKQVKSDTGTLSFKKVRKWRYASESQRVLDTSNIPHDYWVVDESTITKVVKAGIPSIPGIIIYEEDELMARMSR